MIEVVKFKHKHIKSIEQQDNDLIELSSFNYESYRHLENNRYSYTILSDGRPVCCIGVVEYWKGRGEIWAVIDRNIGSAFVGAVKAMKRMLNLCDLSRLEATVIADFEQGHRLVKLFGFELEAPLMRKYGVTGLNHSLYARVK